MSRNTSLPVSAQECAASASIDADPVTTAATDLATATTKFAAKAIRTVVRLAEPPPRAARESWPRNRSGFTPAPWFDGGIPPSIAGLQRARQVIQVPGDGVRLSAHVVAGSTTT